MSGVQVLTDRHRTARTHHRCELCTRRIDPGETYRDQRAVYDCRAYTFKTCQHCETAVAVFDLWSEVDHDEGISFYHLDEYEPVDDHTAHVKAGWDARWRHSDGALWDIPQRAPIEQPEKMEQVA